MLTKQTFFIKTVSFSSSISHRGSTLKMTSNAEYSREEPFSSINS